MELTDRQRVILKTVVEDYIFTAAPVPSEKLAGQRLKVSSATIRNEMVELENLGLLTHPHTSAGRMPSDLGYRYYIEHLMTENGLAPMEEQTIWHQFHQVEAEVDEWGPLAASIMAQMARSAALVTKRHSSKGKVKRVELVSIQEDLVLVVLILQSGALPQRMLHLSESKTRDDLSRIANRLSEALGNMTAQQVIRRAGRLSGLDRELALLVARLIEQSERYWDDDIYYEGILSFFNEATVRSTGPEAGP